MTPDDLLVLVPWLLFAASVALIVAVVVRRRAPRPADQDETGKAPPSDQPGRDGTGTDGHDHGRPYRARRGLSLLRRDHDRGHRGERSGRVG